MAERVTPETSVANYWLFVTDPDEYSFDDLLRDTATVWDGVDDYTVSLSYVGYRYIERDDSLSGDISLAGISRHITDRAMVVKLLRRFVDEFGGSAERCLGKIVTDNVGLLTAYIDSLSDADERASASRLFHASWTDHVPAALRIAPIASHGAR